jgi:hypothetical protein
MKQSILILIATVFLSSTIAQAATAQYVERWPAWAYQAELNAESVPPQASNAVIPAGIIGDGSRDHRYAGLWTGVGLGVGLVALAVVSACETEDSRCSVGNLAKATVITVPVLGIIGALIGSAIPKHGARN